MKSVVIASLLVMTVIVMVPTVASAQDKIFMQVPGIKGGSLDDAHRDWIDVISFSGGATAPAIATSPAPPKQPPLQPCQVSVLKKLDIAGPRLWAATVTGQTFDQPIKIQVVKASSDFVMYEILLTQAQITAISISGSNEIPIENVAFKASTVTLSFTPQKFDGTAGAPITASFTCD